MQILEEKENSLFGRREVKIIVEAEKNPSFPDAVKILAEKFKAGEEAIHIGAIKGKFGHGTFLISGFLYKSKEEKEKLHKKKEKKSASGVVAK